ELGSFYLDIIKDRQYTAKLDSVAQRSCQTAMWHIMEAMVRWMAPIMSFTAQELWEFMPAPTTGTRDKYVFTAEWYTAWPKGVEQADRIGNENWLQLLEVRAAVNRALEQARKDNHIGGSLQAEVTVFAAPELLKVLELPADELRFILLTSVAKAMPAEQAPEQAQATEVEGLSVLVTRTEHEKCSRCWQHREDVGSYAEHPSLCGRCVTNVSGDGETRAFA
ncbi:MAG TPA: class I tRNA ligase family protein, partial [Aliidiomarina sp.]|nr:class I tRNA ligase family protein [Aliidiomarina sp.]